MGMPLHYSPSGRRRHWVFSLVCVSLLAAAVCVWVGRRFLRTSVDVRLDTGDLRICYLGIPCEYRRMPEPIRSRVLGITANSKILKNEWRCVASFPRYDIPPGAIYEKYNRASIWPQEDVGFVRLLLEDLAVGGTSGGYFLGPPYVDYDNTGCLVVDPQWREDPYILAFAASKGYTIPPRQPSTRPVVPTTRP